ncbi:hypothetical protein [Streptomyces nigrescens]|uniref:hypothetical protein n=1 Tax=Streptomyces nigrescens TaxID=1920 RepID=UPI0036FDE9CE
MGSLADEEDTDVEIYRRYADPTVYADSRTNADEKLLQLLDLLGFERKSPMPMYTWHELPQGLREREDLCATRAWVVLANLGYTVNLDPELHCPHTERIVRSALAPKPSAPSQSNEYTTAPATPAAGHARSL